MEEQKSEKQEEQAKTEKADLKGGINQLEALLDEYMVKKAPFALPKGVKEFIATVSPYLIIIFAIMALPLILAAMGLSAFLTPFAIIGGLGLGFGWGFGAIVSLAIAVVTIVMELMAVPGLFKRTKKSWRLLFYVSIISLVGSIISIHGIVSGIIGAIIGWYILFQMKDMYKN
ncbi:MAG: hypothetical protein A2271_01825 [Candidatus Moranbacteria bacterium RIFOXYA12_FULL_35_19]|nr:MAG: hypothetical protein UR78_C0032G0011 [Candidatus Moranbacteria bacterium GW2011_GWF2_35_39]OGI32426.1 MAG: hypothetical protein A2489_02285 [Candidatus Moranbacteria bacterium RIFOXYC12_FULL_36_13]OGI35510.1 MAG: hypothetical protein A2271_01825 [Candidatus Moranbacteria bacterium RIFOXYA12_FULL_35_19]